MLNMHISSNPINWNILLMLWIRNLWKMLLIVHISTRKRVPIISSYIVIFIPLRQYLPFDIHCCYILMTNNVLFIEQISLHSFLLIYHPIESRNIKSSCSWAVISLNKWDDILPNENYQNFITRICKNIYLLSNYANPVCKASDCILYPFRAKKYSFYTFHH